MLFSCNGNFDWQHNFSCEWKFEFHKGFKSVPKNEDLLMENIPRVPPSQAKALDQGSAMPHHLCIMRKLPRNISPCFCWLLQRWTSLGESFLMAHHQSCSRQGRWHEELNIPHSQDPVTNSSGKIRSYPLGSLAKIKRISMGRSCEATKYLCAIRFPKPPWKSCDTELWKTIHGRCQHNNLNQHQHANCSGAHLHQNTSSAM